MKIQFPKKKRLIVAGAVILFAALVVGAVIFVGQRPKGIYAVFLSNGQAYFGTIAEENGTHLLLKNIYYLQFKGDAASQVLSDSSDASLLKLGNELHGPEDWMDINREHILFIERLKTDGKVAKAISAYAQK